MRWILRSAVALIALVVLSCAARSDTLQSDTQHHFSVNVPTGWRATSGADELKLTMGDSFITIKHFAGQATAAKTLQASFGELGQGFVGGQVLQQGETTLGGEHAVFANLAAFDDRSVAVYLRVVATDSGWVFFAGSPQNGFSFLRDTFLKIEHSLQFAKPPAPAANPPAPGQATAAPKQ